MRVLVLSARLTEGRAAAFRALTRSLGDLQFLDPPEPLPEISEHDAIVVDGPQPARPLSALASLRAAIERIVGSAVVRSELGERGYQAFLRWWSRDAHLVMYFDTLRQAAIKRFGAVPWET